MVVDGLVPSGHQVIFNHHDDIVKSVYILSASLNKTGCEASNHTDQSVPYCGSQQGNQCQPSINDHVHHELVSHLPWAIRQWDMWSLLKSEAIRLVVSLHKQALASIKLSQEHWNQNVVILITFSSPAAPKIVIQTTSSKVNDKKVVNMKTNWFQWDIMMI